MTRLVFLRHIRFEKGRRRCFTVSVWRRVKGRPAVPVKMWGAELAEAWRSVRDATA